MVHRRGLILVFLSLMMAVGAAWVANRWVSGQLVTKASAAPSTQLVVTAAMSIPIATKVEGRHLRLTAVPEGVVPTGAYTDLAEVEGKVATTSVARGEILVTERFATHNRGSTLAALVADNMRAVTVRVDDVIGVGGFLLPGNTVDVLAARKGKDRRAIIETILTNIKVLAVDQTAATDENDPVIVRAVTLEMTPKQAEKLVKARTEGSIQLTLRNPEQEDIVPEPVKRTVRRPTPRKAPTDSSVEIIRGTDVKKTKTKS
ncbi:MAG: Flp pilus assembly protein CpaB [Gammaproteobacteria bacterium]|nr:Flp pilus assembly protein CpaB [Gammaproteobacteria bacterium]MBU2675624.1 Flp pilus assembly protein CpaB [Gammaproteobacteria bacterium]NNC56577.1 Flp pilus assembly protein CpaB [Woeseiaceae bacterium]NNL49359.1 Flp pilus assembly protein CpaB [Woeseiaceae bacterium]